MKKNFFIISVFLTLFSLSCEKATFIENNTLTTSQNFPIQEAKNWFLKKIENNTNLRNALEETNKRTLRWDLAKKSTRIISGEAFIVPIEYEKDFTVKFFLDPKKNKSEKNKEPQIEYSASLYDKLIVSKDANGILHEEVVQVFADQDYLIKISKSKKDVRNEIKFDGMMVIRDWSGNLIKTIKFKNGKLIAIGTPKSNKKARPNETVCYTITDTSEIAEWFCYYVVANSEIYPTNCYWNVIGTITTETNYCEYYPDTTPEQYYDEFGQYWDDTNDPPQEKTRKLVAKVPSAYKANGQCIPFSNSLKDLMQAKGISGQVLQIRTNVPNRNIISTLYQGGNIAISENGFHQAIRVNDTVFDNLNVNGVNYYTWYSSMDALGGINISSSSF